MKKNEVSISLPQVFIAIAKDYFWGLKATRGFNHMVSTLPNWFKGMVMLLALSPAIIIGLMAYGYLPVVLMAYAPLVTAWSWGLSMPAMALACSLILLMPWAFLLVLDIAFSGLSLFLGTFWGVCTRWRATHVALARSANKRFSSQNSAASASAVSRPSVAVLGAAQLQVRDELEEHGAPGDTSGSEKASASAVSRPGVAAPDAAQLQVRDELEEYGAPGNTSGSEKASASAVSRPSVAVLGAAQLQVRDELEEYGAPGNTSGSEKASASAVSRPSVAVLGAAQLQVPNRSLDQLHALVLIKMWCRKRLDLFKIKTRMNTLFENRRDRDISEDIRQTLNRLKGMGKHLSEGKQTLLAIQTFIQAEKVLEQVLAEPLTQQAFERLEAQKDSLSIECPWVDTTSAKTLWDNKIVGWCQSYQAQGKAMDAFQVAFQLDRSTGEALNEAIAVLRQATDFEGHKASPVVDDMVKKAQDLLEKRAKIIEGFEKGDVQAIGSELKQRGWWQGLLQGMQSRLPWAAKADDNLLFAKHQLDGLMMQAQAMQDLLTYAQMLEHNATGSWVDDTAQTLQAQLDDMDKIAQSIVLVSPNNVMVAAVKRVETFKEACQAQLEAKNRFESGFVFKDQNPAACRQVFNAYQASLSDCSDKILLQEAQRSELLLTAYDILMSQDSRALKGNLSGVQKTLNQAQGDHNAQWLKPRVEALAACIDDIVFLLTLEPAKQLPQHQAAERAMALIASHEAMLKLCPKVADDIGRCQTIITQVREVVRDALEKDQAQQQADTKVAEVSEDFVTSFSIVTPMFVIEDWQQQLNGVAARSVDCGLNQALVDAKCLVERYAGLADRIERRADAFEVWPRSGWMRRVARRLLPGQPTPKSVVARARDRWVCQEQQLAALIDMESRLKGLKAVVYERIPARHQALKSDHQRAQTIFNGLDVDVQGMAQCIVDGIKAVLDQVASLAADYEALHACQDKCKTLKSGDDNEAIEVVYAQAYERTWMENQTSAVFESALDQLKRVAVQAYAHFHLNQALKGLRNQVESDQANVGLIQGVVDGFSATLNDIGNRLPAEEKQAALSIVNTLAQLTCIKLGLSDKARVGGRRMRQQIALADRAREHAEQCQWLVVPEAASLSRQVAPGAIQTFIVKHGRKVLMGARFAISVFLEVQRVREQTANDAGIVANLKAMDATAIARITTAVEGSYALYQGDVSAAGEALDAMGHKELPQTIQRCIQTCLDGGEAGTADIKVIQAFLKQHYQQSMQTHTVAMLRNAAEVAMLVVTVKTLRGYGRAVMHSVLGGHDIARIFRAIGVGVQAKSMLAHAGGASAPVDAIAFCTQLNRVHFACKAHDGMTDMIDHWDGEPVLVGQINDVSRRLGKHLLKALFQAGTCAFGQERGHLAQGAQAMQEEAYGFAQSVGGDVLRQVRGIIYDHLRYCTRVQEGMCMAVMGGQKMAQSLTNYWSEPSSEQALMMQKDFYHLLLQIDDKTLDVFIGNAVVTLLQTQAVQKGADAALETVFQQTLSSGLDCAIDQTTFGLSRLPFVKSIAKQANRLMAEFASSALALHEGLDAWVKGKGMHHRLSAAFLNGSADTVIVGVRSQIKATLQAMHDGLQMQLGESQLIDDPLEMAGGGGAKSDGVLEQAKAFVVNDIMPYVVRTGLQSWRDRLQEQIPLADRMVTLTQIQRETAFRVGACVTVKAASMMPGTGALMGGAAVIAAGVATKTVNTVRQGSEHTSNEQIVPTG